MVIIMPLWIIISYCVTAAFSIFSIVKLYSDGKKSYGKAALSTYIFYTVLFLAVWFLNIAVPSYLLLLSMLVVFGACFLGHYLGGYTKSRTFDRYLHAFGAFSYSLFAYCILDNYIDTGGSLLFQAIFIFLAGNTLGVLFEFTEMWHDRKKDEPKSQKGLRDTDMDMLANLIGSALAGVYAYFWLLP